MIRPSEQQPSDQPTEQTEKVLRPGDQNRRIIIPGEPAREVRPARPEAPPSPQPPPSPKPPRGLRWRTLLLVLLGALIVFVVGTVWGSAVLSGTQRAWQAIAGTDAEIDDDAGTVGEGEGQYWTCGMHPWVILPEPGLCPICHMDLTPLDPAKLTDEIAIDPVVVQNIGVRLAPVTAGPLTKEIRTVGTVQYDESAIRDVNTKISGWVEELHADETGAVVQEGQPLFEIYSPELYQAQEEYLLAIQGRSRLTRDFLEDARTKLEFFDIGPEQIEALEQRGTAQKTLTITSPHTGVVIEKNAQEGMKIESGTRVYRIADLSEVWVIATVYEYQLPFIKVGQPATMTLPYLTERFEGEVAYIYPFLQEESRQVDVRLEFPNPEGQLKPGMFATVQIESTLDQQAVLAPREAIIATGRRKVAFVSLGEGKFAPRNVKTGVETESGLVEIREGLKPGEKVVTSGQFLLDSESKMRAALAKMVQGEMASEQIVEGGEVTEATIFAELPPAAAEQINQLLESYVTIRDSLVENKTDGIGSAANQMRSSVDALTEVPLPGKPDFWEKSLETAAIHGKAAELAGAKDLDAARMIFASLSHALAGLVEETGVPRSYGERIEALTCPMYPPKVGGAVWLQPAGPARNPYMGEGPMLRCVGERQMLPVSGSGAQDTPEVTAADQVQIDRLAETYLTLQQTLYQNQTAGSGESLDVIRQAALELANSENEELRSAATEVAEAALRQPEDLAEQRAAFKSLSAAAIELVQEVPPSTSVAPVLREVYCPMAEASWLQSAPTVQNPYYGRGSDMADCGTVESLIVPRPTDD